MLALASRTVNEQSAVALIVPRDQFLWRMENYRKKFGLHTVRWCVEETLRRRRKWRILILTHRLMRCYFSEFRSKKQDKVGLPQ